MNKDFLLNLENFFMALADKTRLRLLNLMRADEVCVCFFTEVLNESQPKISRHLAYLRNAGIVETRRDGKWIHYRIIKPESDYAAQVLQDTLEWLASQSEMQKDYENLTLACCAPTAPVSIMRAPRPHISVNANTNINQNHKEELDTFLL